MKILFRIEMRLTLAFAILEDYATKGNTTHNVWPFRILIRFYPVCPKGLRIEKHVTTDVASSAGYLVRETIHPIFVALLIRIF